MFEETKISRRDFLLGASATTLVINTRSFASNPIGATGKSIINGFKAGGHLFANFAKSALIKSGPKGYPGLLSADGYPASTPSSDISGDIVVPTPYFDYFCIRWGGIGSFQLKHPVLVSRKATDSSNHFLASEVESLSSLFLVGVTNPRVEFKFGMLITGATDNGFGQIRLAVTASITQSCQLLVRGVAGTIEANGVWVANPVDSTHFDLVGSKFANAYLSGGEAIVSPSSIGFSFPGAGKYSEMGNLILCRKLDEAAILAGNEINPDVVAIVKDLNPRYVRFLDSSAAIGSTATDFTFRRRATSFSFGAFAWIPEYWVGPICREEHDHYTCSRPAAFGRQGPYADGEIVQGEVDATNLAEFPTLNVDGRGAKPIYDGKITLQRMVVRSAAKGDLLAISFSGTYLPRGAYTLKYQAKSDSVVQLGAELTAAINSDRTLNSCNIFARDSGDGSCIITFNRNAGDGTSFSAAVSGATKVTFERIAREAFAAGELLSFTYNRIVDGWIAAPTKLGLNSGLPVEAMSELCNRASVGVWCNIPLLFSTDSARAFTACIRDALRPDLPAVFELSNEVWNLEQNQTWMAQSLGASLGFICERSRAIHGYYGLRIRQVMEAVRAEWTERRARADLTCIMAYQLFGDSRRSGDINLYRFQGADLTPSNEYYSALGGVNGKYANAYASFPDRPIDYCDAVSYATYIDGAQIRAYDFQYAGRLDLFGELLSAAADFASGDSGGMKSALNFVDRDFRNGKRGGVVETQGVMPQATRYLDWERVLASYDARRVKGGMSKLGVYCYEGGLEAMPTHLARDIARLARQLAQMGGVQPLRNAANVQGLLSAYKNSDLFKKLIIDQYNNVIEAHAGRRTFPAWYALDGPSIWSLFSGDIYTNHFKSYEAIVNFNR